MKESPEKNKSRGSIASGPFISRAVPAPTSFECRGRDGGATDGAIDWRMSGFPPLYTPLPSPNKFLARRSLSPNSFLEWAISCSCQAMAARDYQGSPKECPRDRRRLHRSVGQGVREHVLSKGKLIAQKKRVVD